MVYELPPEQPALTLSERRRTILKIIVQEHISSARPVASEAIARHPALAVSSATVRNEMAALEDLGFITQLHTSAGRVPSDEGYRYYVEQLMEEPALGADEQRTITHQFHQTNLDMAQWLRLAAAVLAQSAHNAAMVTAPRAQRTRFKHLELISIQDALVLLVAVFDGGTIQQQMFVPVIPVSQDELSAIAARLNRAIEGLATRALGEIRLPEEAPIEAQVLGAIVQMSRALDDEAQADVFVEGLDQILSQPEFSLTTRSGQSDGSAALHVVQLVQQGMLFNQLLRQIAHVDGLHVIIGGNGAWDDMKQISVVLSRYGSPAIGGLLGVLGPTRMHYGRAIAVVRYVGEILGEMALELGGHQ